MHERSVGGRRGASEPLVPGTRSALRVSEHRRCGVLERIVTVHIDPGSCGLDFSAGSGATGEAAALHGRGLALIDEHQEAPSAMARRLAEYDPERVGFAPSEPPEAQLTLL